MVPFTMLYISLMRYAPVSIIVLSLEIYWCTPPPFFSEIRLDHKPARPPPPPSTMFINTNPLFDDIFHLMTIGVGSYSSSTNTLWHIGDFLTNSYRPKKFVVDPRFWCSGGCRSRGEACEGGLVVML